MYDLIPSQGRASVTLYGNPEEPTCEGTMGASEDQHLVVGYGNQWKTGTRDGGQPLQECATVDKKLTHPAVHEHHVRKGPVKAFGNGVKDRVVKQYSLLKSESL